MIRTKKSRYARTGAAAVEFALIAPLFILMFLGIIEFGRAMMVQQVIIQASREGAREAALPGATLESVKDVVQRFADDSGVTIKRDDIVATPSPSVATDNEQINVSVEVAVSDVSWVPSSFVPVKLKGSTTMRSEKLD